MISPSNKLSQAIKPPPNRSEESSNESFEWGLREPLDWCHQGTECGNCCAVSGSEAVQRHPSFPKVRGIWWKLSWGILPVGFI